MPQAFAASASVPVLAALLLWAVPPVAAQGSKDAAKTHSLRRMPDGHPDLQGTYDLATLTPMERPAGASLVLTKEQAARLEAAAARQRAKGDAPIAADRAAPPKGGDGSTFWLRWRPNVPYVCGTISRRLIIRCVPESTTTARSLWFWGWNMPMSVAPTQWARC